MHSEIGPFFFVRNFYNCRNENKTEKHFFRDRVDEKCRGVLFYCRISYLTPFWHVRNIFWFEFWPLKYRQLICDDGAALDFYVSIFDSVFSLNSNVHISLVIHAILDQTFDSDPFM